MSFAVVFPVAQEIVNGSLMYVEAMVIGLLFLGVMTWIGRGMATETDRAWLPRYVAWGYLAKLAGTFARYWMVTELYGVGDSADYHIAGQTFATVWRGFVVPVSDAGGQGTAFTEVVTGFIYAIYTPSFLGGFIIFATLCFFGQLLFLSAFRRWFGPEKQKLYAIAILFYPSLLFWPASIGKDALMVLFLGLASYGASRLLSTYELTSVVFIAIGLILAAGIRPHVAGMLAIALVLAIMLGKPLQHLRGSPMRPVLLVASVLAAGVVLTAFSTTFEVGLERSRTTTDVGGFLEEVSSQTGTGGSEIEGVAITTPSQIPAAIITVLFRPLLHEGANPQMIVSALEGTVLLVFLIIRLPQIWRNRGLLRRRAYLTMCFFYTGGFILGFSAIHNLGILARQRVQVLPMLLALVVALAWPEPNKDERELAPEEESVDRASMASPRAEHVRTAVGGAGRSVSTSLTVASLNKTAEDSADDDEGLARGKVGLQQPVIDESEAPVPAEREKTGWKKQRNRPVVRDRIRADVIALHTADPTRSLRDIAERVDASTSSVRRVLVEEGLL